MVRIAGGLSIIHLFIYLFIYNNNNNNKKDGSWQLAVINKIKYKIDFKIYPIYIKPII